jgi:hypothetical protein
MRRDTALGQHRTCSCCGVLFTWRKVVFWVSITLLGAVLILPWLRIDWLQTALAIPGGASAALLLWLTYSPGYLPTASLSKDVDRMVYFLALFLTMTPLANYAMGS